MPRRLIAASSAHRSRAHHPDAARSLRRRRNEIRPGRPRDARHRRVFSADAQRHAVHAQAAHPLLDDRPAHVPARRLLDLGVRPAVADRVRLSALADVEDRRAAGRVHLRLVADDLGLGTIGADGRQLHRVHRPRHLATGALLRRATISARCSAAPSPSASPS